MDTAFLDEINWIAAFCGGLAYFMLGALWYSRLLFAPKWLTYVGIDPNKTGAKKGIGGIMLTSFVLMLIASAGIAVLRAKLDINGGWMSGIKLGGLTGLSGATAISISYLYEQRPLGLHLINGGYTIAGTVLAGIIICSWT
ncbi:DUF1761 domain-containing protein [Ferruginibacter sp. HRS2-29]|uniref:DUF1761 domain-containing protein n=1 Tax=Ferruginibacter sp. HRS2-29 TaxID=2487334 RepID=UPI0020CD8E0F|nr:DUF1761 domain-containing protein [Ferruginibacter sp. HRS2-29]MCP9751118.1 DUF1761 domain-containing protein [Ferruginibacter sp. HRS2-29]